MTSKKEEAARLAAAALEAPLAPRIERRAPRVAMSAVTDFTGELSRVERELQEAREKLAQHDGALPTRELDPKTVRPSRFANRIAQSFEGPEFEALKSEIASAGGNVQPIKVRPVGADAYEIVYGHRRHRACLELELPVLSIIHEGLSDKALYEEMSRENEQREDLSAYELALHFKRGIDQKLYKNWAEIAAVLGKSKGLVSRYTALAELPKAVVDAFPSPNDIQPKWAQKLVQVLDADRDAVLKAAREVKGRGLLAKQVFEALINQPAAEFTRVNFSFGGWREDQKRVAIEINKEDLAPAQLASLREFLNKLSNENT